MKNKLTILMPVYEISQFLSVAIDSLKKQTFKDYVCNILTPNLSEDDTRKLQNLISEDSRFSIHKLSLSGIAFALNYGLNITKTKYLARMDADDISHNSRLEKQIDFLEKNPGYVVVGCKVQLVNGEGHVINNNFKFFENNREIRKALRYRNPMCHPALVFRTETLLENKGYLYGNNCEDHELFLRIARNPNSKFKNLSECLFSYRRHDDQLTDIKYAKNAYCNIAGFMFTEFLLTFKLTYLVGIFAYHPILRKIRAKFKNIK